jgi:hypothetical protein
VTTSDAVDVAASSRPPRIVLVTREDLPINLAANAAAVLGATIGAKLGVPVGADAQDASRTTFPGIVTTPIPILVADPAGMQELFNRASADATITVACLTEVARQARTYESYLADLAATEDADADIVATVVAGPRNRVTKLTKRLPLLTGVVATPDTTSRRTAETGQDVAVESQDGPAEG